MLYLYLDVKLHTSYKTDSRTMGADICQKNNLTTSTTSQDLEAKYLDELKYESSPRF